MRYLVGPKGQVVIAKDIRQQLGVKPGWQTLQRLVDDHLEVYFIPPEHSAFKCENPNEWATKWQKVGLVEEVLREHLRNFLEAAAPEDLGS